MNSEISRMSEYQLAFEIKFIVGTLVSGSSFLKLGLFDWRKSRKLDMQDRIRKPFSLKKLYI